MAITHFITGAHECLINEVLNTRVGPFERFVRWQQSNALELVAKDEDMQMAVEKMGTRELKRVAEDDAHHEGQLLKLQRPKVVKGPPTALVGVPW